MATKRPASEMEQSTSSSTPPTKKTLFDPVQLGSVSSQEEMDIKVLKFQNKKLADRLELRKTVEEDLRDRIQRLERRQGNDEAVLCLLNRYWSQLDEDIGVLLKRFDDHSQEVTSETTEEKLNIEGESNSEKTENEIESSASDEESKDKLTKENEAVVSFITLLSSSESDEIEQQLQQRSTFSKESIAKLIKVFDDVQQKNEQLSVSIQNNELLDSSVKSINLDLQTENKGLRSLVTSLQEKHHTSSLTFAEQTDKLHAADTKCAELINQVDNLQYDLDKAHQRADKLENLLSEALSKLKMYKDAESSGAGGVSVSQGKLEEMNSQLNVQTELASNRLAELEKVQDKYQESIKEAEKLKMDLQHIPEEVIMETPEYKNLQSQFSVLYNEALQMKAQLDDTRTLLQSTKNSHLRQVEQMESDELSCQKKLRTEVIQLEDTLAQVRKEYEMLRIEFEQTIAANEQAGPINREMRHVITSLQTHNQQLKAEVVRYKKKLREANAEIHKLRMEAAANEKRDASHDKEHPMARKDAGTHHVDDKRNFKEKDKEGGDKEKRDEKDKVDKKSSNEKSQESQREMKLLLDMYKGVAKEQRDKVQLMAAEKKARDSVEEIKQRLRHMEERERQESKKLADEEAIRKIRNLEEHIQELQKKLTATKQEEEALLSEMDVTGQAFEDMQEQNVRLLQQLREKDDAYFKLMSERIKSNQIHKLLREEKDVLADQVTTLQTQVEAQNQVVRKLEEKERILHNSVTTMEKEMNLRQQALEHNKRKALELSQTGTDSKKLLDRYQNQVVTLQAKVVDKASEVEQQAHKYKRCQEEIENLRRKLERARRIELAGSADEILLEENKTYKTQLTCPCCNVKRKDTVLTKCFHLFCSECIKTRYETRQRKCPECNAAFGANGYHRIYLG
uniref:E3 ubiquitin protein ligase n=1 Tax=Saccoglossus kowalevskii TaxID=10224 RepID=A0ABM0MDJ8_SACKO|nr:PREDICTED: E3 ubiquitin-protein ligase BRE1B-like [Saccoglossus kowalevskii]